MGFIWSEQYLGQWYMSKWPSHDWQVSQQNTVKATHWWSPSNASWHHVCPKFNDVHKLGNPSDAKENFIHHPTDHCVTFLHCSVQKVVQRGIQVNMITRTDLPLIKQKKRIVTDSVILCCFQSVLATWALSNMAVLQQRHTSIDCYDLGSLKSIQCFGGYFAHKRTNTHTHIHKVNSIITCFHGGTANNFK